MYRRDGELEPCGDCGGRAEIMFDNVNFTRGIYGVTCINAGTDICNNMLLTGVNTAADEAIEYWNNRQAAKRELKD